jgi:hypothetical protein
MDNDDLICAPCALSFHVHRIYPRHCMALDHLHRSSDRPRRTKLSSKSRSNLPGGTPHGGCTLGLF